MEFLRADLGSVHFGGEEAGEVTFKALDSLVVTQFGVHCGSLPFASEDPHAGKLGTYAVPGVDLVATCAGDYDPEGLLVWFPGESRYGFHDPDHDQAFLFPEETRWSSLLESLGGYLEAQWAPLDSGPTRPEALRPWPQYLWTGA